MASFGSTIFGVRQIVTPPSHHLVSGSLLGGGLRREAIVADRTEAAVAIATHKAHLADPEDFHRRRRLNSKRCPYCQESTSG